MSGKGLTTFFWREISPKHYFSLMRWETDPILHTGRDQDTKIDGFPQYIKFQKKKKWIHRNPRIGLAWFNTNVMWPKLILVAFPMLLKQMSFLRFRLSIQILWRESWVWTHTLDHCDYMYRFLSCFANFVAFNNIETDS